MGDNDRCSAESFVCTHNGREHDLAGFIIQRPGGLIAQQYVRRFDDRASHGDTLLLSTGKLRRKMVEPSFKSYQGKDFPGVERLFRNLVYECHILQHSQAGYEIVELKDKTDMLAPISCEFGVVRPDQIMIAPAGLARGWGIETTENVQ